MTAELHAPDAEVWLSPISVWVLLLVERRRLILRTDVEEWLDTAWSRAAIREAPFNREVARRSRTVRVPHEDPADRFLAATAQVHDLTLVTDDENLLRGRAYVAVTDIDARMLDRELKKGSAELLILLLVEARPRLGYELSKLIESRSEGRLKFHIASLYPLLYRLEERAWIQGTWVEKAGERRRRFYRLTPEGRRVLATQRKTWRAFVEAVARITGESRA